VEPFGNIKVDKGARQPVIVQEIREPAVDVLEEGDHILVVAEMPGIATADLHVDLNDDVLTLSAERGDKKYRKEVLLPRPGQSEGMSVNCNNGIVKIRCQIPSQK
jgi:HSP20 family protein